MGLIVIDSGFVGGLDIHDEQLKIDAKPQYFWTAGIHHQAQLRIVNQTIVRFGQRLQSVNLPNYVLRSDCSNRHH